MMNKHNSFIDTFCCNNISHRIHTETKVDQYQKQGMGNCVKKGLSKQCLFAVTLKKQFWINFERGHGVTAC